MHKSNQTGGKSHKRYKKHRVVDDTIKTELLLCKKNQVYAVVKSKSGGSRLSVMCSDNIIRSAIIPGKFYKKIWFNEYDLLICELNIGGNDNQCYITHKYTIKDAVRLKNLGHVTFDCISDAIMEVDDDGKLQKNINDMYPTSSESESYSNDDKKMSISESDDSSESIDINKL